MIVTQDHALAVRTAVDYFNAAVQAGDSVASATILRSLDPANLDLLVITWREWMETYWDTRDWTICAAVAQRNWAARGTWDLREYGERFFLDI